MIQDIEKTLWAAADKLRANMDAVSPEATNSAQAKEALPAI